MIYGEATGIPLTLSSSIPLHYSSSNPTAAAAMDAIKKKMQAMKLEKDNAMDRADACEQQAKDANLRAERVSK